MKLAFVCVHNSCRSQMAEAIARHHLGTSVQIYSAGTEPYPEIKPLVWDVLREIGISPEGQYPKLLSEIPAQVDLAITMGCDVACPSLIATHKTDWALDDPSDLGIEAFRTIRDAIVEKVLDLKASISFESMEETAYLLRNPKNAQRLLESIAELEAGGGQERTLL